MFFFFWTALSNKIDYKLNKIKVLNFQNYKTNETIVITVHYNSALSTKCFYFRFNIPLIGLLDKQNKIFKVQKSCYKQNYRYRDILERFDISPE